MSDLDGPISGLPGSPPRRRVIISTDVANEADDAFAVAYALLSPSLDVRCVVPTHFGHREVRDSLAASRQELDRLLTAMGATDEVRVCDGSAHALPDYQTPVESDGAQAIIEEAGRDDRKPLFLLVLGPLTDVASAYLMEPGIAEQDITVVWIGGPSNPPDPEPLYWPEFNLSNDLLAANVVFESQLRLWQIPMRTYASCAVSNAELLERVAPHGPLGEYLVAQYYRWVERLGWDWELKHLSDCAAVGLAIRDDFGRFELIPAPTFNRQFDTVPGDGRPIRVYQEVDRRFLFEDLFTKIKLFATHGRSYPPRQPMADGIVWGWPR